MSANKFRLGFPIKLGYMTTITTSTGCILGVNIYDRNTGKFGFVFNKLTKFSKCPSTKLFSLLMSNRYLEPFQVLKSNALVGVFSKRYNLFRDYMIGIFLKSSFFTRKLFEVSLRRWGTTFLKLLSDFSILFSYFINMFSREKLTSRGSGKVNNSKVYTNKVFDILNIFFGNFYSLKKEKLIILIKKISFSFDTGKVLSIIANKWDFQSTSNRPDRGNSLFNIIGQKTIIISNSSKKFKPSLHFPIKFVSIHDLTYTVYNSLSRKMGSILNIIIDKVMNFELVKNSLVPYNFGNSIASSVRFFNGIKEQNLLFLGG